MIIIEPNTKHGYQCKHSNITPWLWGLRRLMLTVVTVGGILVLATRLFVYLGHMIKLVLVYIASHPRSIFHRSYNTLFVRYICLQQLSFRVLSVLVLRILSWTSYIDRGDEIPKAPPPRCPSSRVKCLYWHCETVSSEDTRKDDIDTSKALPTFTHISRRPPRSQLTTASIDGHIYIYSMMPWTSEDE